MFKKILGVDIIGLLFSSLLVVGGSIFPYSPTLRSVDAPGVRSIGMGMAYTAIANDETMLRSNPAGIGVRRRLFQVEDYESIFYFAPIKFSYSEEIYRTLVTFGSFKKYLDIGGNNLDYSVEIFSPTDIAYVGNPWAISFFTRSYANVHNSAGGKKFGITLSKTVSQINVGGNVYSFSILSDKDFHIGIGAKLLYILQIERTLTSDEMDERFSNIRRTFDFVTPDKFAHVLGQSMNFFEGFAMGVDIGLLWEIHFGDSEHRLNLGIMLEDAPTYAISAELATDKVMKELYPDICKDYFEKYPAELDGIANETAEEFCTYRDYIFKGGESSFYRLNGKFGIAYLLPEYWGGFFSDTIFAFDVHRVGDKSYSFVDMYHIGISSTIFDLSDPRTGYSYRMNISIGINNNQFNAGYLVHLNKYIIGYNYFREKALKVNKVNARHTVTFAFYF